MSEVAGVLPAHTSQIIKLLGHPDVVKYTNEYFSSIDGSVMCTTYEAPWNCAREAEAKFQTIHDGWFGGIGIDTTWCENCRKKVMGTRQPTPVDPMDVVQEIRRNAGWKNL